MKEQERRKRYFYYIGIIFAVTIISVILFISIVGFGGSKKENKENSNKSDTKSIDVEKKTTILNQIQADDSLFLNDFLSYNFEELPISLE